MVRKCLGGIIFVLDAEIPAKFSLIKSVFLAKQESNVLKALLFGEDLKYGGKIRIVIEG